MFIPGFIFKNYTRRSFPENKSLTNPMKHCSGITFAKVKWNILTLTIRRLQAQAKHLEVMVIAWFITGWIQELFFHFSGLLWRKRNMGALKKGRKNITTLEALFVPSPAFPFKSLEGTKPRKSHFCILALLQSPFTAQNLFHNVPFIKWKKFFKWETIKSELP